MAKDASGESRAGVPLTNLDKPLFEVFGKGFSGKALILLGGGIFLLYKATKEIHHKLEASNEEQAASQATTTSAAVCLQIIGIDVVYAIESGISAHVMARQCFSRDQRT